MRLKREDSDVVMVRFLILYIYIRALWSFHQISKYVVISDSKCNFKKN
jgi:hypothetical protein